MNESFISSIIIVLTSVLLIGIVSRVFMGDDNPIEECCEEIIYDRTQLDIDLSPETKEIDKRDQ